MIPLSNKTSLLTTCFNPFLFVRDFIDIFGESDSSDDEEFEGFRFEMPDEVMEWTLDRDPSLSADPDAIDLPPQPGPTSDIPIDANAMFYFQLFFGDDILSKIVEWTEANAAKQLNQKNGEQWKLTYLGIILISNTLLTAPRTERYFIVD